MLKKRQQGFTLVELVLAMAIFSFVLMIVSGVTIFLYHIYQNGLVSRRTQQNGRYAMQTMTRYVRYAGRIRPIKPPKKGFCFYPPDTVNTSTFQAPGPDDKPQVLPAGIIFVETDTSVNPNVDRLWEAGIMPNASQNDPKPYQPYEDCDTANITGSLNRVALTSADVNVADLTAATEGPDGRTVSFNLHLSSPGSSGCTSGFEGGNQFCGDITLTSTVAMRGAVVQ